MSDGTGPDALPAHTPGGTEAVARPGHVAGRPRLDLMDVFVLPGVAFALFVAVPLAALVYRAARAGNLLDSVQKPIVREALGLSLVTSTLTLAIVVLLGTPLAYVLARTRFPGKRVVDTLVDLPIVLPPVVAGVALLMAFGRRGVFGS